MTNTMFVQIEITSNEGTRKDYVVRVDEYSPVEQMLLDLLGADTKGLPEVWSRISESMGATETEHLEDSDGMVISVDNTIAGGPYVTVVFYVTQFTTCWVAALLSATFSRCDLVHTFLGCDSMNG